MIRTLKDYSILLLKGVAMGAADVVPGVSGGTIAFISGIYEELLESISSVSFKTIKVLRTQGINAAWKQINGNFLISLLIGIGISVVSLAKIISWLLENEPVLLWAFFFGLVLASIFFIGKQITKWNVVTFIVLTGGTLLAYWITTLQPMVNENSSSVFLFISGAFAICAMILPGISGAFILVLLGAYRPVLEAVHSRDFRIIFIIGAGAIVGLLTFSRLLKWLFHHYKNLTLAILTGFVLGSLNKIWPWKKIIESKVIEGKEIVLEEKSISPFVYGEDNQLLLAVLLAAVGFMSIILLEKLAVKK
jgi:putative membrane protein